MRTASPLFSFGARLLGAGALAATLLFSIAAEAQSAETAATNAAEGPVEANIRTQLAARLKPGIRIESVLKSPFLGLYEARVGNDLIYTDEKVTYLFMGSILDGKTLDNLTEERINKLTAVKFSELPLKDAIKMVNGTGRRQIAYFADPNCSFCKQFERSLSQVKDTTVYVFLYPILSPDSTVKARALWCASDRTKAWNDWMLRGQMPASKNCDNPLEANTALGQRMAVRATPTTILPDGTKLAGAVPLAQLEKAIADATPN